MDRPMSQVLHRETTSCHISHIMICCGILPLLCFVLCALPEPLAANSEFNSSEISARNPNRNPQIASFRAQMPPIICQEKDLRTKEVACTRVIYLLLLLDAWMSGRYPAILLQRHV